MDAAASAATAAKRQTNLYLNNSGQRSADAANRAQFLAGSYAGENSLPLNPNSEGGYRQRIRHLREQAEAVSMTDEAYGRLRAELVALEAQYRKLSGAEERSASGGRNSKRSRLRELGSVASGIGIGGFFGGPEGLLGSTLGAGVGSFLGPGGMVAGAQLGASVGLGVQQLRMQAAGVADMVAELNLAKTTLAQVSANQQDYNQKLQFARQVSADYSVGLQATIDGYAKVAAAASANGLTLKETETIYRGLISSGVAFGASQDDLKSIITATTQILSKGKISAEELSGQLGERIPGAVAKFAQATGRPLAQLAKDLQDGKVKIADFVKFAKGQLNDYDAAAKLIGSSPEKAGERLNLALTRMTEVYGGFFQTVGAGFQDTAKKFIDWINSQSKGIKTMVGLFGWASKEIYRFQTNTPAVKAFQSLSSQLSGSSTIKAPEGFSFSPNDPYGAGRPPFVVNPRKKEPDANTNFWADRFREGDKLFPTYNPTLFNQNTGSPALGDLTATDDKAAKKAEAEAKRQQALADKETQRREKLEADERRRAELLAENAIRLADRVFEHQQSLVRKRYELENSLIEATRRAQEAALIGPAREALSLTNRLAALIEASKKSVADGKEGIAAINQEIKSGKASAANSARYADVPYSEVGTAGSFDGSSLGGDRTGYPKFITANQMRAWLKSQGYERTSGDYTNRGHQTKNHMLNAIDIGELDGSYPFAVQRAKDLEARLRRTGAFGTQLFGPTRDPKYHKDHVHIPTPEGRIRVTPALAQEMQLGTTIARNQPTTPRTQPGVVSGLNRNIGDNGGVELSQADLKNAKEQQKLLEQNAPKILQQQLVAEILASTEGYRTQTEEIKDQQQELKMRNRLLMEGVKPQIVDQQMELNAAYRTAGRNLTQLQKNLLEINKASSPELYDAQVKAIDRVTEAYRDQIDAQEALNAYVNDRRDTFRMKESVVEGVDSYTNSIGTLNEAVTNLTQKGIGGLSSSLKELLMTGTTDFRAFALSLISDMMDIVLQQGIVSRLAQTLTDSFRPKSSSLAGAGIGFAMNSIVPSLFGGAGPVQFGAGGGGTAGFGMGSIVSSMFKGAGPVQFARGGVMTSHGPLKLQTYARGGIANSPQVAMFGEGSMPEAYVPLPDGKRIPVAVSYPAIPGIPTGGSDSAAQEQAGSIGGSTFERTDAVINRMVASARQESAARAAASVAASGGGTTRIQLETTRINSVDYVTLEQARGIADASSARSTARQQRALQANPSARRSVGI
jgi:lambda family phage tail tape measure protein